MRHFNRYLFNGNDRSAAMRARLLAHVEHALSLNSAREQGAKVSSEEVEDIVRDVAAALLGREITLGKELPYYVLCVLCGGCGISGCTCK